MADLPPPYSAPSAPIPDIIDRFDRPAPATVEDNNNLDELYRRLEHALGRGERLQNMVSFAMSVPDRGLVWRMMQETDEEIRRVREGIDVAERVVEHERRWAERLAGNADRTGWDPSAANEAFFAGMNVNRQEEGMARVAERRDRPPTYPVTESWRRDERRPSTKRETEYYVEKKRRFSWLREKLGLDMTTRVLTEVKIDTNGEVTITKTKVGQKPRLS